MDAKQMSLYLAVMFTLGLAALAGLAALLEWREARALPGDRVAAAERSQSGVARRGPRASPLVKLAAGAGTAARAARAKLASGDRSESMYALDATKRAIEVGHHVAHGAVRKHFGQALKKIKAARAAIQTGEPGEARRDIRQAASALQTAEQAAGKGHSPETHPLDRQRWARYEGATLINAHGIRIGEVRRIQPQVRERGEALLLIGGGHDVLGLFDLGGDTRLSMPVDSLLWGKLQAVGGVHVVLPTFEASASRIRSEVAHSFGVPFIRERNAVEGASVRPAAVPPSLRGELPKSNARTLAIEGSIQPFGRGLQKEAREVRLSREIGS